MLGQVALLRQEGYCPCMLVRSRKDLTFIQPDKFPVCFHCSEDYLHQHGFSCTVPAEQSNNITCIYFQVNISQQLPGTEILNNTIYFKQVMHNFTIQSTDQYTANTKTIKFRFRIPEL